MKALYFENKLWKVAALKVAERFSRYAALGSLSPLRYADIPEPQLPNERWLKVRNRACGLCGTDIHLMFMDIAPGSYSAALPGIARKFLGHELIGEVVEAGSDAGDIAVGDRVAMRIDWPSCNQMEIDPPCPACAAGQYMQCENLGLGALPVQDTGGGFSPYMVMHRSQPYRIPDALSDDEALLLEPLACAVHGVLKAPPAPGERVLVIGGGTLGLLTGAALRALAPEAHVWCLTRYAFQADVARKFGAEIVDDGARVYERIAQAIGARHVKGIMGNEILLGGFDVVYDSVGSDASVHNALRWTKAGGRLVLIGINFKPGRLDYSPIWAREIAVTGINCHGIESDGRHSFDIAAELLQRKRVVPDGIITHRFPVSRYRDAIKAFLNKRESNAIKIVLMHDSFQRRATSGTGATKPLRIPHE